MSPAKAMTDCAEIKIVRKKRLKVVAEERIDIHTIARKRRLTVVRKTDFLPMDLFHSLVMEDVSHYVNNVDDDGPNPLALYLCQDCFRKSRLVLPKGFQFEGVCRICGSDCEAL